MQRSIPIILLLVMAGFVRAQAEELIAKGEVLNLDRCLSIAAKNQPNIIISENTVKASKSRVGQAGANFYPQINLSSSYTRTQPMPPSATSSSSSVSGAAPEPYDQYAVNLGLQQLLFDFGKSYTQYKIQSYNRDSSIYELDNTTTQVVFNVKQAYYGALQAKRSRDVAQESVNQFQQHLERAQGFYQVGTVPKYDVTKAEVDLSNAQLSLINAENAYRVAMANLNNTMGAPEAPEYTLEDNLSYQKYETSYEEAIERAYKYRPDLLSLLSQQEAAKKTVTLSKLGYAPVLTGNADYKWLGREYPLQDGWDVGVGLTFNIFNGFLTKYQIDESKANLFAAKANESLVRQTILFDVQQAFLNLKAAEDGVPTSELAVKYAQENLDLANGRYAAGVGSPVEITDAQIAYINAENSYIQALYNYKIAQASLEKAMGAK